MRILIPIFGFNRSGGQRVLSRLADQLILKGHEVIIVVPSSNCVPYYVTNATIITFKDVATSNKKIDLLLNLFYFLKKCREVEVDVAVANYNLTAYVVAFLSFSVRKFYYVQAYEALQAKRVYMKALAFLSYLLPLKKIVNSASLLPQLVNNYVAVVPAGIDTSLFECSRAKFPLNKKRIGIIGRKESYKGTLECIVALSEFLKISSSQLEVNIAIHVPQQTNEYLDKYNFFEINNEIELADFYKSCDIILAVGLIEDGAFHYPCAEAMSSGCLVISNYSPLVENSETKLFLDTYSKDGIINKLRIALELTAEEVNKELKINREVAESLSWNIVAEKFNRAIAKCDS